MSKKLFIPMFVLVFGTSAAFAQGRGGGGGGAARGGGAAGAPVGGPSPQQGNQPSNSGRPDSAPTAADHKAAAAKANAADPTSTHGFKNYGQYVAANHVSEHLGIP